MPKRSSKSSQSVRRRQAARETNRKLKILRDKGLIGKNAYKGKPSGGAYRVINKYSDVIEGRAVVVKPKTKLIPKHMRRAFRETHGRLIVPKPNGTISTTVTRKKGKTVVERTRINEFGVKERERVETPLAVPTLREGEIFRISMPNWRSARYVVSEELLEEELNRYRYLREWIDIAAVPLRATPFA